MVEPDTQGSFVARFWLEGSTDQNPTWRGHVQHVQSEEECYFQNLSTMRDFLEQISGVRLTEDDRTKD